MRCSWAPEPPLFPRSSGLAGRRRPGMRTRWQGRKPAECSIGPVRNRAAIIAGGVAAAAAVAYGLLRRKPTAQAPAALPEEPAGPDPRAQELREKLAASSELPAEREALREGQTPPHHAPPHSAA